MPIVKTDVPMTYRLARDTAEEITCAYPVCRKRVLTATAFGREIEALGLVKGSVVQSKNFGKDFMAGMKTLVGGEIESYTDMLNEARQIATKRMVDEAEALGADAVVNIRFASASIMQSAAEITAYGTAVKYKE